MDLKQAIRASLTQADFIVNGYLDDLTDAELLARPCSGGNHIAWQLGHLIGSERHLVEQAVPGKMPMLPEGFGPRHNKEAAANDDPAAFLTKEEYLALGKEFRAATLAVVGELPDSDFDQPISKVRSGSIEALVKNCRTIGRPVLRDLVEVA